MTQEKSRDNGLGTDIATDLDEAIVVIVEPSRTNAFVLRDGTAGGLRRFEGGAGAGLYRGGEDLVSSGSESCLGSSNTSGGGTAGSSNMGDTSVLSCRSPARVEVWMLVERGASAE